MLSQQMMSPEQWRMLEWKIVNGESRMEHSWYLKDKQTANGEHIILYCSEFEHVQASYQSLGMLWDICLVPGTNIVYALVKQSKTYLKIRYFLKMSNYKRQENWRKFHRIMCNDRARHWDGQCNFVYSYFCSMYYYMFHDNC